MKKVFYSSIVALATTTSVFTNVAADTLGLGLTGSLGYGINSISVEANTNADESIKSEIQKTKQELALPWTGGIKLSYDFGDDNMFGIASIIEWGNRSFSLKNEEKLKNNTEDSLYNQNYTNSGISLSVNLRISPIYTEDFSLIFEVGPRLHLGFIRAYGEINSDGKFKDENMAKTVGKNEISMFQVGGNVNIGADFANHIVELFIFASMWFIGGYTNKDMMSNFSAEIMKNNTMPIYTADKNSIDVGLRLAINLMPLFA